MAFTGVIIAMIPLFLEELKSFKGGLWEIWIVIVGSLICGTGLILIIFVNRPKCIF